MYLAQIMQKIIRRGSLTVVDAYGKAHVMGDGTGPAVTIALHRASLHWQIALDPYLRFGEAYMDGGMTVERGSLGDLLGILIYNSEHNPLSGPIRLSLALRRLERWVTQHNPIRRARRNVAHHYDLDDGLYNLFLDTDKQYSCAYFSRPNMQLEEAQQAKKAHLASKLRLAPELKVLDIGCGWGGMAIYLARETGARVVGVTLSEHQHKIATERVRAAGLQGRVDIRLRDYRQINEPFDRIVSVGMFEHVGIRYYKTFFSQVSRLLRDDGVALIHFIGRTDPPGATNAWIGKYIFPGVYSPALSEVLARVETSGLLTTDVEVLRLHYAHTLHAWLDRFTANRERALQLYDERFCRMWEFYLNSTEQAFRIGPFVVFQMQLTRQLETLPLTRDYMAGWEQQHTAAAITPARLSTGGGGGNPGA